MMVPETNFLKNKTILILSPQSWGTMFVSKHHYAIELAKRGSKVYFLNPPDQNKNEKGAYVNIVPAEFQENVFLVHHALNFSYSLKFHLRFLFDQLMRFHVRRIVRTIPQPIDIVWSFDIGNLYPLNLFPGGVYKIFHPVDEPLNKPAIAAAKGADIIFSVTTEILDKYAQYPVRKYVINHGISENFLRPRAIIDKPDGNYRVGFAGNLLRSDIDRLVLLQIIRENAQIMFDFWGNYSLEQANIGGTEDEDTKSFINVLRSHENVSLHGAVPSSILAEAIFNMDAFLICYDVEKDQSKGTNYHKIMEYLSTGKVIISNNVTTYSNRANLVQMVAQRTHNNDLPSLFKKVMNQLSQYNSPELQHERIAFASNNSYAKQIERIEMNISYANTTP